MPCCGSNNKSRLLVVGGAFSGLFVARVMKKKFHVTVVDAKEFFEYTPGILRAFVKPAHFDSLSFTLQPVLERSMGVKFIWGEVKELDGKKREARVKVMFEENKEDIIQWDFCLICAGCNFGPFHKWGESLWFPVIHEDARKECTWKHIDERFIEGRRRHILEEYNKLRKYDAEGQKILVVGAGFIGVEWVTELNHYFPNLDLTVIDFLPKPLGPLPGSAAEYCSDYMNGVGIHEFYNMKYAPDDAQFWKDIALPDKADVTYVCIGVKASNYFMPPEVLSDKGPGGGGWIHFNWHLQVVTKPDSSGSSQLWADGRAFAVGDCNYGCIEKTPEVKAREGDTFKLAKQKWEDGGKKGKEPKPPSPFELPPIPKISYPGEEQALHACNNIKRLNKKKTKLNKTWWPWGAGMFATSLGPHDACFVLAANDVKGSGYMVNWWIFAALQKEIIETSKIDECKNGIVGRLIWHFVHHTPMNCWGKGPWIP